MAQDTTTYWLNKYSQTDEIRYFFKAFYLYTIFAKKKQLQLKVKRQGNKSDINIVPFSAWRSNYANLADQTCVDLWLMRDSIMQQYEGGTPLSTIAGRWDLDVELLTQIIKT